MDDCGPVVKTCRVCHLEKPLDAFPKQRRGKYGVATICRPCLKDYSQKRFERLKAEGKKVDGSKYRREHPEWWATYAAANKAKHNDRSRRWAAEHPEEMAEQSAR